MLTSPEDRARYIAGLRELADYLAVHGDVPVPTRDTIIAFASGASDAEERRMVDAAAQGLGTEAAESPRGSGHYEAVRCFGPVEYKVLAISRAHMELHEAKWSYADNIAAPA